MDTTVKAIENLVEAALEGACYMDSAVATLDMMPEAMNAATQAMSESSIESLSDDELQLPYAVK